MRDFADIAAFLRFMSGANARMADAGLSGLSRAARAIETEAKHEIGTYQISNTGPFAPWEELHDYTKEDRVKQGFSENDPGYRTGEMQRSIERAETYNAAVVGSQDDHLVWFDQGTENQAPRSVLGLAAVRKTDEAVDEIAGNVARGLAGVATRPKV